MANYDILLFIIKSTHEEWRIVFIISSNVYFISGLPYVFFASGDVEKWAILEKNEEEECEMDANIIHS